MKNIYSMVKNYIGAFLIVLLIVLNSCNKEEGTGGEGSIKGVVYVKEFSILNNKFIKQVPASDEDVYILYGSNSSVGDKVTTSNNGSFEFSYLLDGSYKIYVYSSDSLFVQKNKYVVMSDVSIQDGKTVIADTLFIIKLVDPNSGGTGQICGKVFYKEYDHDFKYFQRIIPASAEDVFLSYYNDSVELNRVRASYDGSFLFKNLIDNNYKIYVFQDDTSLILNEISKVTPTIQITEGNKVDIDTIFIYKGLDVDKGNATISGKITLLNYKSDQCTIKDVGAAQDYDVFLVYGDHIVYDLDTKTGNDGVFSFPNLIKGKYTIYVYTQPEDEFGCLIDVTEKAILKSEISITTDNQIVNTIKFITKKL